MKLSENGHHGLAVKVLLWQLSNSTPLTRCEGEVAAQTLLDGAAHQPFRAQTAVTSGYYYNEAIIIIIIFII